VIERVTDFSLRQPFYIAGGVITLVGLGLFAFRTLPFEAFPDLTANSVSVIADAPG
jgi:cobalt-zinc-cadmium resistance protein CzcA